MKTRVSEQLKELLQNTTQEQFDRDWAAIEALGFEGPSVEEFIEYSLMPLIVADMNIITDVVSSLTESYNSPVIEEYSYAQAA